MAQPSHRLNLLRKFEKQIAPLERHHVDFLGLCEDTRREIRDLESKGMMDRKYTSSNNTNLSDQGFTRYGAAVGDERAQGLDPAGEKTQPSHNPEEAGRREQSADAEHPARTNFTTNENEGRFRHERAKRALKKAKSLKEPPTRSKWFGVFNRRKPSSMKFPSPTPAPQLERMRTLEARPFTSAERAIKNDRGGRPRRRLSKVQGSMGSKRGGAYARDERVKEKDGEENGLESVPTNAHDIEERERERKNERSKCPSAVGNNEEEAVRGSGGEPGVEAGREKGKGGNEGGSETDGEGSDGWMIMYNDVNEIGRAKRIGILDRWRRDREARQ